MLVISTNLALSPEGLDPECPLIGWKNIVTLGNIISSTSAASFPVSNLANPATHLEWRGTATHTDELITIPLTDVEPVDYVGIARHNFGSAGIGVSIDGDEGFGFVELVAVMPQNDSPLLLRFLPQSYRQIRIHLHVSSIPPRAAVVYAGKLLVVERRIYVGHTPLPHGRRSNVISGMSETGNFLGRIVTGEWRETSIPLQLITPSWLRSQMLAFLAAAGRDTPFFFAWRPASYPLEVGYCWLTGNPMPVPVAPSNRIAFQVDVAGIA
jgi:hypothetical protein